MTFEFWPWGVEVVCAGVMLHLSHCAKSGVWLEAEAGVYRYWREALAEGW